MASNDRLINRSSCCALAAVLILTAIPMPLASADEPGKAPNDQRISGPFAYQNLAVYLIHGKDVLRHKKILTLQEALAQKKFVVHETSSINELQVENLSTDSDVFIQAGDIVKGGKQDRVLAYDLMVPPKSGKIPLAAFCVESGRWSRRGSESSAKFSQSSGQLPGKALRLAVLSSRKQRLVWKSVKEQQNKLSKKLNKLVSNSASPSSLQLTLEDKDLKDKVNAYFTRLEKCVAGKKDVIGFVVTINGKVESSDVYGSSTLFRKMWPKLLRSVAVYAFVEQSGSGGRRFESAESEEIEDFLADGKGDRSETKVNDRIHVIKLEGPMKVTIWTRDQTQNGAILHRIDIAR